MPGFYERHGGDGWQPFRAVRVAARTSTGTIPNLRFVDLDGDGLADVLITGDDAFTWYPSLGPTGFGAGQRACSSRPVERGAGPRLVFADRSRRIYLGRHVRRRAGGPRPGPQRRGLLLAQPRLRPVRRQGDDGPQPPAGPSPEQFDPRRVRLADVDGSGATDLVYLGRDGRRVYLNQSGDRLGRAALLPQLLPAADSLAACQGGRPARPRHRVPGLVLAAAGRRRRHVRYVDLMAGGQAAPADRRRQQPRRRDADQLRPVDPVLPGRPGGRPAVDHPAAVPGARASSGSRRIDRVSRNRFTTQLRLPPRLLRRRRARVPRLRDGRAAGHRGPGRARAGH